MRSLNFLKSMILENVSFVFYFEKKENDKSEKNNKQKNSCNTINFIYIVK